MTNKKWWVYVLVSYSGTTYVGATTDPKRRLRQHNGEVSGGAKCTKTKRPWSLEKVFGPYNDKSSALKAEYALKHSKKGKNRIAWSSKDSDLCIDTDESKAFLEPSE